MKAAAIFAALALAVPASVGADATVEKRQRG